MAEGKVLRFTVRDARLAFPNLAKAGKFGFGARGIIPADHTQTLNPGSRAFLAGLGISSWRANPTIPTDKSIVKLPTDPKAKVKTLPLLDAIALAVAKKKWNEKAQVVVNGLRGQDKLFFHDGDTKAELDGFEGNWFIALGSKGPVPMFNQDRSEASEKEVYSGSYCNFQIDVWAQDNTDGGKRINASVYGVQKLRDGDAFASGGPVAEADDFDEEIGVDDAEEVEDEEGGDLTA